MLHYVTSALTRDMQSMVSHTASLSYIVKRLDGLPILVEYPGPGETDGEVQHYATGLSTSPTPNCILMLDGIATSWSSSSFRADVTFGPTQVVDTLLLDCACSFSILGGAITAVSSLLRNLHFY